MKNLVSVIISTYNGAKKIPFLLEALKHQTFVDFEIIIMIDGSTDDTVQKLKEFSACFNKMRVLVQENSGRTKVKNRGAKEASGDLLIFYDDDVVPIQDSIEMHVKRFFESPERLITGNPIELFDPTKTDIQNYKANLTTVWVEKYKDSIVSMNQNNLFFTASNCSMSRVIFEHLGGFDERLTDAEDYDIAYRALQMGTIVYFDRANKVIHNDPITCVSYIKRLREYQIAHGKLAALYPERKETRLYRETNILKRFAYRLFAQYFLVRLIDQERLFFMPKRIRYKLYTIVIHSLGNVFPSIPV
jgi:glycosyltransferase involved in cell wall biosynthesis